MPIFTDTSWEANVEIKYSIYEYHPKNLPGRRGLSTAHDYISSMVLRLKEDENEAVRFFTGVLETYLASAIGIAVVPSHTADVHSSGIGRVAKQLCHRDRTDLTHCLRRKSTVHKLSHGGNRSIDTHLASIEVTTPRLVKGRDIVLLDDVITTGNSMEACKQLLLGAGAERVACLALARTVRR